MLRTSRSAVGGLVYHVLNRGNGRLQKLERDKKLERDRSNYSSLPFSSLGRPRFRSGPIPSRFSILAVHASRTRTIRPIVPDGMENRQHLRVGLRPIHPFRPILAASPRQAPGKS